MFLGSMRNENKTELEDGTLEDTNEVMLIEELEESQRAFAEEFVRQQDDRTLEIMVMQGSSVDDIAETRRLLDGCNNSIFKKDYETEFQGFLLAKAETPEYLLGEKLEQYYRKALEYMKTPDYDSVNDPLVSMVAGYELAFPKHLRDEARRYCYTTLMEVVDDKDGFLKYIDKVMSVNEEKMTLNSNGSDCKKSDDGIGTSGGN